MIMLRNAIVALILLLLALGVGDARVPTVGDEVSIGTNSPLNSYDTPSWLKGEIMYIGNDLICIKCSSDSASAYGREYPYDVCIGIGAIVSLTWTS